MLSMMGLIPLVCLFPGRVQDGMRAAGGVNAVLYPRES